MGGVPSAPVGKLNKLVPAQSAEEGVVEFVIPAAARAVVLLVRQADESTRFPWISRASRVGDVTVIGFGVLALLGLGLVGIGAVRGARILLVAGTGFLLALGGAWVVGLPGVALGLIALAFWRRRPLGA